MSKQRMRCEEVSLRRDGYNAVLRSVEANGSAPPAALFLYGEYTPRVLNHEYTVEVS